MSIDPHLSSVRRKGRVVTSGEPALKPAFKPLERPAGLLPPVLPPGPGAMDVQAAVQRLYNPKAPPIQAVAQLKLHETALVPLEAPKTPELDPLRQAFDKLAPKTTHANLRLLPKNRDAWLGVWDVLTTAPGGVDASYFILERDVYGMAFLGALLKKAREGHPVRLLVDSAGDYLRMKGFTLPTRGGDYLQELVAHGAEVRIYNPMHKKLLRTLVGQVSGFERLANNHDKLVRSSIKAQTGGRNLAADYLTDPADYAEDVYRDTCVLIEGRETSEELGRAFEREFYQEDVTFKQFKDLFGNWVKRDGELLGAYLMMDTWVKGELGLSPQELKRLATSPAFREEVAERVFLRACERFPEVNYTSKPGWRTSRSMRKRARELVRLTQIHGAYPGFAAEQTPHQNIEVKVLDRVSAAAGKHDQLTHAIRTAAMSAQKRIRIHNPYVTLSEAAIQALEVASQRGVQIELLTNSPDSSDNRITQAFFLEDWPRLLARIPSLRIFVLGGGRKLHAKSIEVDDRMTFVKSYNLDLLSERVNSELGIVAWSRSFAQAAGHAFEADLDNPLLNTFEYRIKRDAAQRPVFDSRGEPVVDFGAKHHIAPKTWRRYKLWRWGIRMLRKLPGLKDHQRPALAP